jgi:hypothetical protein
MTVEEIVAQNQGTIDALTSLCGVLLATHPMWKHLSRNFHEICETALQSADSSPIGHAYAQGYARAATGIQDTLRTIRPAVQMKRLRAP